jgi:hypothetical protein
MQVYSLLLAPLCVSLPLFRVVITATYKVELVSACACIDMMLWVHSLVTCVTFSVRVLLRSAVRIHNGGTQTVLRKTRDLRRVCVDTSLSNKV